MTDGYADGRGRCSVVSEPGGRKPLAAIGVFEQAALPAAPYVCDPWQSPGIGSPRGRGFDHSRISLSIVIGRSRTRLPVA